MKTAIEIDKKSLLYLGIVLIVAILVGLGCFYYYRSLIPKPEVKDEAFEKLKQERMIKQQLEELARLKGDAQPLTEQEIKKQIKELDKNRQETQPLTEEEIQKQLEELNKLR